MASVRAFATDTPSHVRGRDGVVRPVNETMSLADFMALDWPEKQHWELIRGTPILTPSPIPFHQSLLSEVMVWMLRQLDDRPEFLLLYDEDVLFPDFEDYLRPDVSIFTRDQVDMNSVPVRVLPLLVVEALSPSTGGRDWGEKKEIFAQAGVPEYWIADPSNGALAVHLAPANGNYTPQVMDAEGFLTSPFFGCRVKIHFDGKTYRVESRA